MAHINLSFGVKGGTSTAHGTSGGEIKNTIATICQQIEREITTQMRFAFDSTKIAKCCQDIETVVRNNLNAVPLTINDTQARQQIDALVQYARQSLDGLQIGGGADTTQEGNTNGRGTTRRRRRGGTRGAGTQGSENNQNSTSLTYTPFTEGDTLNGLSRQITENSGRTTSIVQTYRDIETGVTKTQRQIVKANGEIQTTTTESTSSIISDLNKVERKLKNLEEDITRISRKSIRGINTDEIRATANDYSERLTALRNNLLDRNLVGFNIEEVQPLEQDISRLQETISTIESLANEYPRVISKLQNARVSYNKLSQNATDLQFYGIDASEITNQEENIRRITDLQRQLKITRERILNGTVSFEEISGATTAYAELQRRVTEFTSANSAMQASVRSSDAALRNAKNTIIQNNKVYSEARAYYDCYRNAIESNMEVSGRWHELLNKMETGGFGNDYETARASLANLQADTKEAGAEVEGLRGSLKKLFSDHFGSQMAVAAIGLITNVAHTAYTNVLELDKAMVELKKVTDETDASYEKFRKTASDIAKDIGATVADTINSTADFARLGYTIDESAKLAEAALLYKNVGDGIDDISEASESIISTMKAFNIEASNAISIVDKFNIVGNNFAISSAGIGEALTRSAASLAAAGNTLEESIALITAANSVIQDPDVVGTAMKTLSMYLRASKTEAEEIGIDTDGMADSVSKLRQEIKSLTGVDIMKNKDEFKSTIQILREIAEVWDDLSDVTQANIMERLAGKRQGNVLASIMTNWDVAENALTAALDSNGSAVAENEKYLDSIDGKINKLKASYEDLSSSLLNSGAIKFVVDGLNGIVNVLQAIEDFPLNSILGDVLAISGAIALKNKGIGVITPYKDQYGQTQISFGGRFRNAQQADTSASVRFRTNINDLTGGLKGLTYKNLFGYTDKGLQVINHRIKNNTIALKQFYADAVAYTSSGRGNFTDYLNEQLNDTKSKFNQLDESAKIFAANGDNFKAMGNDVNQYKATLERTYAATEKNKASTMSWGSTIKSFAINAVSNLAAAAIGYAVQLGINALVEWAQSAEKAKQRADELVSSFNSAIKSADSNAKKVEEIIGKYERLSKGVDNLGKNISLTNDEYDEYKTLTGEIAEMFPSLIKGYDEEGNAILGLKGNVESLRDAYKEAQAEAYNLLITGSEDKKPEDIVNTYINARNKENSGDAKARENTTALTYEQYLELQKRYSQLSEEIREVSKVSNKTRSSDSYQKLSNLYQQQNEIKWHYRNIDWDKQYSANEFESIRQTTKSELQVIQAETESSLMSLKTLLNAYLLTNSDYKKLSEQGKKYASVFINSIDETTADKLKNPTDVGAYAVKIVEAFQNKEVADSVSSLFDLGLEEGKSGEITQKINEYIGIIAKALNESEDDLKIRFGFEEPEDLLTRAKNKFKTSPSLTYTLRNGDNYKTIEEYNEADAKTESEITDFLENLSLKDLDVAMKIDDLFDEGLDKAAEKIQKFKNANLSFEFNYKDYSESVDKAIKTADKIQTVIDSVKSGEYISGDTITELASAFPDYSERILGAADDTEKLKSLLDDMLEESVQPLINTLQGLDNLSAENQEAVNGLIGILTQLADGGAKKIQAYSDALSYLGTLSDNLDLSKNLTKALNKTGSVISQDLLNSVKAAYPELNSYIETYLANNSKANAEALVSAYKRAYNEDIDNFFAYNQRKGQEWFSGSDWESFLEKNTSWVNDFREAYEINLNDYSSYLEAVEAITKKHESDFDTYYKNAMGGYNYNGYLPTSVLNQIKSNFEEQYDDNPINDFWIKTEQYRLGEVGSATDDNGDAHKEAFEKEYNQRKHWLNMSLITEAQFYEWLGKANEEYFANNEDYISEYRQYLEEFHSWEVKVVKSAYEDIIEALDSSIDKAKDKIDSGKLSLNPDEDKNVYKYYDKVVSDYGEKIAEAQKRIGYLLSNGGYENNKDDIDDLYKNIEEWNKTITETGEESSKTLHDYIVTGYKDAVEDIEKNIERGEYSLKFGDNNNVFQARNDEMGLLLKQREEIERYIQELLDKGYDETSDSIRDLKDEIDAVDDDLYKLIETNLNDYYQQQIDALEDVKNKTEDIRKEEELRLNLMKAQKALLDAQNNRNQLVFSGGQFSYEVDQEAVLSAMDEVKDAQQSIEDFNIDEQIDKLKESQDNVGDEVRNIFNWLTGRTEKIPEAKTEVSETILNSEGAFTKFLKDVMAGSSDVGLDTINSLIKNTRNNAAFDNFKVESASNLQGAVTNYNGEVVYNSSVTVGDINISVQGGTSIEMLQEFADKVGSYFQQYTIQNNYRKR